MANNTWKNYTQKSTALSDNDEVMLLDSTDEKNKRGLVSKFWDYVVDKMSTAVIGKLETENKTVIGAINALNGKLKTKIFTVETEYGNIYFRKSGNSVSAYGFLENLPTNAIQIPLKNSYIDINPNYDYAVLDVKNKNIPYASIGSVWIYRNGIINLYKPIEATSINIAGCYVVHT